MRKETWEEMKRLESLIIDEGNKKIIPLAKAVLIIKLLKSTIAIVTVMEIFKNLILGMPNITVILVAIIFLGLSSSLENYIEDCVDGINKKIDQAIVELEKYATQDLDLKTVKSLTGYYQKVSTQ